MSYDIELKNKVTGETATMRHPQYVRGGNVPARLNDNGEIRTGGAGGSAYQYHI